MTILVTGAKGQVGRELIDKGRRCGLKMAGIDMEEVDIADAIAVATYLSALWTWKWW